MKPRILTIHAFGPYAQKTTVDFTKLERDGLFLVCGATGAGKTTIFDAIAYALFGEASGGPERRSADSFRSDYAAPESETFAELEFEHRGELYTVRRTPEYLCPKKIGEGMKLSKRTAVLHLPDGKVLENIKEVNQKIQELIGLTRPQFAQTVMIAQGDFRKILTATSADRKAIFQKLFDTVRYADFQDMLSTMESEAKAKINSVEQEILLTVRDLILPEQAADSEVLSNLKTEPEYAEKALAPLKAICKEQRILLETLAEDRKRCADDLANVTKEADRARQQNKLLAELSAAEAQAEKLDAQAGDMELAAERLNLAMHAAALLRDYHAVETADQQLDAAQKILKGHLESLPALEEARDKASAALEAAQKAAEEIPALQEQKAHAQHALDLLRKSEAQRDQHRQAASLLHAKAEAYRAASEAERICMDAYNAGQAGLLAETLQPGMPCPVCGATEHPHPAARSGHTPTDAEVTAIRQKTSDTLAAFAKQKQTVEERQQALDDLLAELQEVCGGEIPTAQTLRETADDADQQITARNRALTQAQASAAKAERDAAAQKAAAEESAANYARTKESAEKRRADYADALTGSVFENEAAFLGAVMAPDTQMKLQNQVQTYLERKNTLRGQIENLRTQCTITEPLPLAEIEQDIRELNAKQISLDQAYRNAERICDTNEKVLERLKPLTVQRKEAVNYEKQLRDLYFTVSGQLSGKAKISFEAYVQQFYFRHVVTAANERLRFLTNNTYSLRCRRAAGQKQAQTGLDLEVFDSGTGAWRDVSSLSGGESFLASLALALGLSDVVQAQSGGIRLDAMFIDEGFGSLDENLLSLAMQMLTKLADGSRLIGVISHVAELREAIPSQIVISKTESGSTLTVRT